LGYEYITNNKKSVEPDWMAEAGAGAAQRKNHAAVVALA
jgi:hypothetical protein